MHACGVMWVVHVVPCANLSSQAVLHTFSLAVISLLESLVGVVATAQSRA
jgi:hypothetical protein